MIFLLAHNPREAERFAIDQQWRTKSWSYVQDERKLRGVEGGRFVILDGFWRRPDSGEIIAQTKLRKMERWEP